MFKAFTVLALIPGLFGYGSKLEATTACKQWINAGVTHDYVDYYSIPETYSEQEAREIATNIANSSLHEGKTAAEKRFLILRLTDVWMQSPKGTRVEERQMSISARRCEYEDETKQVLGLESATVRTATDWDEDAETPDDFKVVKRFRF